jgi:NAD(P)-dependent dehydrogenase (short-subunit alcohol dehydrogenase family)
MKQKVALITGASRGLGLELARTFARNGYQLIITARGEDALESAAHELKNLTAVESIPGDVADETHVSRLVEAGLNRFGRIDVLINNASELGPSPMPELARYPVPELDRVFRVNVLAPLHLTQLVLPQMLERGDGAILNVTSDAGVEAYPSWGGYGTSKAALEHLSRVLSAELEASGIRVYVVDPGDMNTQMHRDAEPGEDLSNLPLPDVPAPAFLWLVEREQAAFGRFQALDLLDRAEAAHVVT